MKAIRLLSCIAVLAWTAACDKSGGGEDLDPLYGGECVSPTDCDVDDDPLTSQPQCFIQLAGGWCGSGGCDASSGCPAGTRCVEYNAYSYCFEKCSGSSDCNGLRTGQYAAECSSEHPATEGDSVKVCVIPVVE
ncbi:MAG: hypothetical protein ABIJ56_14610 [Pseudomonadota bacterium]